MEHGGGSKARGRQSGGAGLVFRFRHLLPFAALAGANAGTKRNTSNATILV